MQKATVVYPYNEAQLKEPKTADQEPDLSKRWYIEFWVYSTIERKKVRVKRDYDINKYSTSKQRRKIANGYIRSINRLLEDGYVLTEKKESKGKKQSPGKKEKSGQSLKLTQAVQDYIDNNINTLAPGSMKWYQTLKKVLTAWLEAKMISNIRVIDFSSEIANDFFDYLKTEHKVAQYDRIGVSNKSFNNYHGCLLRIYNDLVEREIIKAKHNRIARIAKKQTVTGANTPFSNAQLNQIRSYLVRMQQEQLLLFINFIYFTMARPREELRLLKVADLLPDKIRIDGYRAKTRFTRYPIISPELEALIQKYRLRDYPSDYYVFTLEGTPGPVPTGYNYFYRQHSAMLKELGLKDKNYSLYGYKHTANCNLFMAGVNLKSIQDQNGHTSLAQTEEYLRSLGMFDDQELKRGFPSFGSGVIKTG